MSRCKYCGSNIYGPCSKSPSKIHEHHEDEKRCEYCGVSTFSTICTHSPTKRHTHGSRNDRRLEWNETAKP
jgi:hypothetical protein